MPLGRGLRPVFAVSGAARAGSPELLRFSGTEWVVANFLHSIGLELAVAGSRPVYVQTELEEQWAAASKLTTAINHECYEGLRLRYEAATLSNAVICYAPLILQTYYYHPIVSLKLTGIRCQFAALHRTQVAY